MDNRTCFTQKLLWRCRLQGMVAKIASDEKKPDGQTFIPPTRQAKKISVDHRVVGSCDEDETEMG